MTRTESKNINTLKLPYDGVIMLATKLSNESKTFEVRHARVWRCARSAH